MNASSRLTAALSAAQEGRYEEALNEYIWFHEHALEEEPSLRGVRLSFALSYWRDLANVYPPALAKLNELSEQKCSALESGSTDWELFNDVVALNEVLGNQLATYKLFVSINQKSHAFASSCARAATPAMVLAQDFQLARSFLPNPIGTIEYLADQLNQDATWASKESDHDRRDRSMDAFLQNYIEDVTMLASIVSSAGDSGLSKEMIYAAINQVEEQRLRSKVETELFKNGYRLSPA